MAVHFDVRSKILLLFTAGICTFLIPTLTFEIGITGAVLLLWLLCDRKSAGIGFPVTYVSLVLIQLLILPRLPETLAMLLSVPVVSFRKMFPCILSLLFLIKTTKVNEAIATMTRMHLPKAITITFAVTLRYIPVLGEEWQHIKDAMAIRRLSVRSLGLFRGIRQKVECYLVPVLISSTKTAEHLSAAAITRGIENPSMGTCRGYRKMCWWDYQLILMEILAIVISIIIRLKG